MSQLSICDIEISALFWGGDENTGQEKTSKECRLQEGEIMLTANLLSGNGQLVLHMPSNAMSF